jgi:hypothetical protein
MINHPDRISRPAAWSFILALAAILLFVIPLACREALIEEALVTMISLSPLFSVAAIIIGRFSRYRQKKGRSRIISAFLSETGLALGIASIIYVIFLSIPSDVLFGFVDPRSKVSRAKNDMRSIATALESYYNDHNCYPQSTSDTLRNMYAPFGPKSRMASQPTFGLASAGYGSITTPVAYMQAIPADPFAPVKGAPLCYYALPNNDGWILWSAGPDRKYDLTSQNIGGIYRPAGRDMPDPTLISLTYDPTNGIESKGDVWRLKG